MSKRQTPQVFSLDEAEPRIEMAEMEADEAQAPLIASPAGEKGRRFPFLKLIFAALVGLGLSLLIDGAVRTISEAISSDNLLGFIIGGFYILLIVAILGLILREAFALLRLGNAAKARMLWALALATGEEKDCRAALDKLRSALEPSRHFKPGLKTLAGFERDIMSGHDRMLLAERTLFIAPDEEAKRLILASAQRTLVVTAVSPRALIDILYVAYESLRLISGIARTYGVRPTPSALMRLVRLSLANLAITGGIAATDGLMEQTLGHGAASKLSRRFGEGVLNGFLITRVGLAAIMAARPVPFTALAQPKLGDLAKALMRREKN